MAIIPPLSPQLDVFSKSLLTWIISTKSVTFTKPSTRAPKKLTTVLSSNSSSAQSIVKSQKSSLNKGASSAIRISKLTENQRLKRDLLEKLKKSNSDPVQILKDDGDWSQELFWIVVRFLAQSKRSTDIYKVFELWKTSDNSRVSAFNYKTIIELLADEGLTEEVALALDDMKSNDIDPSSDIYCSVIHCFTRKERFEDAVFYINEMEQMNLKPTTEIFDGLIQAYANHSMFDDMGRCVKKMKAIGCAPDHITYNILIREFSRAGLLKRMESTCQTVFSKRMSLQASTRVAILAAYAKFGILDKMEMVYRGVMNSKKTELKDDLIRKVAGVYIEYHMFSRLADFGNDLSIKIGRTNMVWCLRILSHACLMSRMGIVSVVQEMESQRVPWNATIANIMLLAYLKMKDLRSLKVVLSEMLARYVKPDLVTFGVLFDASRSGFDASKVFSTWRRMGLLNEAVEINTDPLVLAAFGKGHFLQALEDKYSSIQTESQKNKVWSYRNLINLVNGSREGYYTRSN